MQAQWTARALWLPFTLSDAPFSAMRRSKINFDISNPMSENGDAGKGPDPAAAESALKAATAAHSPRTAPSSAAMQVRMTSDRRPGGVHFGTGWGYGPPHNAC